MQAGVVGTSVVTSCLLVESIRVCYCDVFSLVYVYFDQL